MSNYEVFSPSKFIILYSIFCGSLLSALESLNPFFIVRERYYIGIGSTDCSRHGERGQAHRNTKNAFPFPRQNHGPQRFRPHPTGR